MFNRGNMKKETPKSFEQNLYESCPALAKYESSVLGEKQWAEYTLSQKQRDSAGHLMGQMGMHPDAVPPDLLMYMKRFIRDWGQGDETKGVQMVFNALVAAAGHRQIPNLTSFLRRMTPHEEPASEL